MNVVSFSFLEIYAGELFVKQRQELDSCTRVMDCCGMEGGPTAALPWAIETLRTPSLGVPPAAERIVADMDVKSALFGPHKNRRKSIPKPYHSPTSA